ncbi:hypothetical protein C7C46_01280 [Streptomyces tateyamensis]|uniref:DUF35 domain-containing protein n=1 Tax=Streptomyces tateyamensis TaxID=565073 RepID=A0A2V4NPF6_9ACTN|nr:hypothetical protein [Streptomyces tateyamensis]PYC88304.1 hypothetical protein C7C46_01280 [Streptomyces tateyamensis]
MNQTLVAEAAVESPVELIYRQCGWCSSPTEHFRLLCPVCGSTEMHERSSAGLGVVRRIGAVVRSEYLEHRIRQNCAVTLDEGLTIAAVVTASRYEVVPVGTRVQLHAVGEDREVAEFRLL